MVVRYSRIAPTVTLVQELAGQRGLSFRIPAKQDGLSSVSTPFVGFAGAVWSRPPENRQRSEYDLEHRKMAADDLHRVFKLELKHNDKLVEWLAPTRKRRTSDK